VGRTLPDAPVQVSPGGSAIAPVEIEGLPAEIEALGRRWQRKVEFHMTVIGQAAIEKAGGGDPSAWDTVTRVVEGRSVGPIRVTRELRRVHDPQNPDLETIVVMVECPALPAIYRELSNELGANLSPLPSHVTLFSTDPKEGIGINDEEGLAERTRRLSEEEAREVRRAMRYEEVFEDSP
jgi:hypothetical protein